MSSRRRRINEWTALIRLTWRTSPVRCWAVLTTLAVTVLSQPVVALALRAFTAAVVQGDRSSAVRALLVAAVSWALGSQVFGLRNLLRNDVRERVEFALSEECMSIVSRMPGIGHLEDPEYLDQIELARRSGMVADTVWSAAETAANVLAVAATMLVLATVSPLLLLTLPLAVPTLWLNRQGQMKVGEALREAAERQRTTDRLLDTLLDPVAAIENRVTGAHAPLLAEYRHRWEQAERIRTRARLRAIWLVAVGWAIFLGGFVAALAYVADSVSHGHGGPGDLVLMLAIARQQQLLVQTTVEGFSRLLEGVHVANAYFWLRARAARVAVTADPAPVPERLETGISLRGVSFGYPGAERRVLSGLDLDLPAGSMVALVGTHGSGKTSLVKLLTGMYPADSGTVLVDGTPMDRLDPEAWRARITCGFQDFVRFQAPAGTGVGLGDLPYVADRERITRAVAKGGATGVVAGLQDGLDTQLGGVFGGVELSGGQWQKLAIARTAMRQDPLLVVLDEPTAALDPVSEYDVFQRHVAFARELGARHGTVTVIVSHRFSTVRMADKIVVLSGGTIAEVGTHDELMAVGGGYAGLYELQQSSFAL